MNKLRPLLLFAILGVLLLPAASAADGSAVTIEEAVTAALNNSPLVKDAQARAASRAADAIGTRRLTNPELETEIGFPLSWDEQRGDNELEVSLAQPFRLSHGALRNRLADLIESAGSRGKEKELLELVLRVKQSFAQVWLLGERERVLGSVLSRARSLNQFVKEGLAKGAYGAGEEALFRAEAVKSEAELRGVSAEALLARSELTQLTGESFQDRVLVQPVLPAGPSSQSLRQKFENGVTKIQIRSEILMELARSEAAVARRDAFPEFRPKLFFAHSDDGRDILGVGLSFDLPVFGPNSAERLRKTAEAHASRAHYLFTQSEAFKSVLLNAGTGYALRKKEVELYAQKVLPALSDALVYFEEQVRKGQGNVFQVWQTLREYLETNERYLELWTRAYSDYAALSILLEEEF